MTTTILESIVANGSIKESTFKYKGKSVFYVYPNKEARKYYDELRKRSPQYEEIIEADGDNDNFLDDREYAVFIEKADYVK